MVHSVAMRAIAVTAIMLMALAGCSGSSSSPKAVASVRDGPVQLEVLEINRDAGPGASSVTQRPTHYVTVKLAYRDVGTGSVLAEGASLRPVTIEDEGGPVTDTDNVTGVPTHNSIQWYLSCGPPPTSSTSSKLSDAGGIGASLAEPLIPNAQLTHGQSYGPFTLCFEIAGSTPQPLALGWSGDPIRPGYHSFVVPLPST